MAVSDNKPPERLIGPLQKLCSACKQVRPSGWFSRNGKGRLRSWCRECMRPKRSADAAKRRGAVGDTRTDATLLGRLYQRQLGLCTQCHISLGALRRYWHVDHIRPIAKGGQHVEANLQLLHPRCNLRKAAK